MAGKTRRSADATSASGKALRLARATKQYTVTATSTAFAQQQHLVRPLALVLALLVLIWVALTVLGRFQLWMTAAGVCMVLLSVASAVQEFKHPAKTAQTYQDLLDATVESCSADKISLPSMEPTAATPIKSASPVVVSNRRGVQVQRPSSRKPVAAESNAVDAVASPAIVPHPVLLESGGVSELRTAPKPATRTRHKSEECVEVTTVSRGRRSATATGSELSSKLLVLHCGTVIDIDGSHGFLIPHDLSYDAGFKTVGKKKSKASGVAPLKLPLVIPFDLDDDEAAAGREELAVGRTVEFAFSDQRDSSCKVCALHVTPVASDGEIEKSRHALLSCKQAREQSFAKAMGALKAISPRHEPVKHVDLIKYAAEQLDDHVL